MVDEGSGVPHSRPLDTPLWFGPFCFHLGTPYLNPGFRCIWRVDPPPPEQCRSPGLGWAQGPSGHQRAGKGCATHWISRKARFSTSFTLYLRLNLEERRAVSVQQAAAQAPQPGSPASPGSLPGLDHVPPLEALEPVTEDVALGLQDEGGGLSGSWASAPAISPPAKTLLALRLRVMGADPGPASWPGLEKATGRRLVTEWARPGEQREQRGRSQGRGGGQGWSPKKF